MDTFHPIRLLQLFVILAGFNSVYGQSLFTKEFQFTSGLSHTQATPTLDGGVLLAARMGVTTNNGNIALLKLNAAGHWLWSKSVGSIGHDERPYYLFQKPDSGYVVAGWSGQREFVIQTNKFGTAVAASCFTHPGANQNEIMGVIQMANGDLLYTFMSDGLYVTRLDPLGGIRWTNTLLEVFFVSNPKSFEMKDGNIISIATTEMPGGLHDIFICTLDTAGNFTRQWVLTARDSERPKDAIQTEDGEFYITGTTNSFGRGENDIFLLHLDTTGEFKNFYTYGHAYNDEPVSMSYNAGSGLIAISGNSFDSLGTPHKIGFLVDRNGDFVTGRTLEYTTLKQRDLFQATGGDYWMIGFVEDLAPSVPNRLYLSRLNQALRNNCDDEEIHFVKQAWSLSVWPTYYQDSSLLTLTNCGFSPGANPSLIVYDSCINSCPVRAVVSVPSYSVCQGGSLLFESQSQFADSLQWFRDNVLVDTSGSLNMQFPASGFIPVTLVAKSSFCTDTNTFWIHVIGPPPTDFDFAPEYLQVHFDIRDSSDRLWTWDFGDGTTGSGNVVTHSFPTFGAYNVCALTTNVCGNHTVCKQLVLADSSELAFKIDFWRAFTSTDDIQPKEIITTRDGGFVVLSGDLSSSHEYLNKFDRKGNSLWMNEIGDFNYPGKLIETSDGDILISLEGGIRLYRQNGVKYWDRRPVAAGFAKPAIPFEDKSGDFFLLAANDAGYVARHDHHAYTKWIKKYVGSRHLTGMVQDTDTSYFIYGDDRWGNGLYLARINAAGDLLWSWNYDIGTNGLDAGDIILMPDSTVIISSMRRNGNNTYTLMLMRINQNGDLIWNRGYDTPFHRVLTGMERDLSDRIYVYIKYHDHGTMVLEVTENGGPVRAFSMEDSNSSNRLYHIHDVSKSPDGGFVGVGYTSNYLPDRQLALMKIDSNIYAHCNVIPLSVTLSGWAVTRSQPLVDSVFVMPTTHFGMSYFDDDYGFVYDSARCYHELYCEPEAGFSYVNGGNTFEFSPSNQSGRWFNWTFGDGTPAVSDSFPTHTYLYGGTYQVCQWVANRCGRDSICDSVIAPLPVGARSEREEWMFISHLSGQNWIGIHANSLETLQRRGQFRVSVFDLQGKLCLTAPLAVLRDQRVKIDVLPPGVYLVIIRSKDADVVVRKKIMKVTD